MSPSPPATATASRKLKRFEVDLGQAHQSALKEAETDAMKRALMTFGNPFGLALYDKRQREVTPQLTPQHQERVAIAAEPRSMGLPLHPNRIQGCSPSMQP